MHTQRETKPRDPTSVELADLRVICEQFAVPLDQVGKLWGCELDDALRRVQALDEAGCIKSKRFLEGDATWIWPSHRGARLSGLEMPSRVPSVASLKHRRALNAVRIHLAHKAPHGKWVCERALARQRERGARLPDAVLQLGVQRHAIEVEITPKVESRLPSILDDHSERFDAIVYFCAPWARSVLKRMAALNRWHKLRVADLPEGWDVPAS
jgi:hypothetical protein